MGAYRWEGALVQVAAVPHEERRAGGRRAAVMDAADRRTIRLEIEKSDGLHRGRRQVEARREIGCRAPVEVEAVDVGAAGLVDIAAVTVC